MYYMPVWELDELQIVGAHVRCHTSNKEVRDILAPEAIEERYQRFGGIIHYVIPLDRVAVEGAVVEQESVLTRTSPADAFLPGIDIEKIDEGKENISDFVLQYKVHYGGKYEGEDDEFRHFEIMLASNYVERKIDRYMTEGEIEKCLRQLHIMFIKGETIKPKLFELVVRHALLKQRFSWESFSIGIDPVTNWEERKFRFNDVWMVGKLNANTLKNMKPGILYIPLEEQFPAVDMLFEEDNSGTRQVFGVQVTFQGTHAKPLSAYKKVFEAVGLEESDKVHIYFVTNPLHLDGYLKRGKDQFFIKPKKTPRNIECSMLTAKELEPKF